MEQIAVLRYAKALFEIAVEKNAVDEYNIAARGILEIINTDEEFAAVINHRSIAADEKMATMTAIFKGKIPEDFLGIFALLFKRGRQSELIGVLERFEVLYKEHKRIAIAKITSAVELPPHKLAEISAQLTQKTGKTIEFEKIVDPTLIAGFKVEVDGHIFDATTKYQIAQLTKQLMAGRLMPVTASSDI
ncbi:MAG: ATP synthase F1 subunit delta [Defluviitaleaceae bacterium]|nr:ATP synthase F1 subunit delta [Defluviitaleaceae bacterium]